MLQTHIDFLQETNSMDIATPLITIYGNMVDGTPVQVRVTDFLPYLYASTPEDISVDDLSDGIAAAYTKGKCMNIRRVQRQSIYGYSDSPSTFYQMYFNNPYSLRGAKAVLENGVQVGTRRLRFKIYESGFPIVLRFMNDLGITGMSYIRVKKYTELPRSKGRLIVQTSAKCIEELPLTGEYMKLPPMKILSFDIETCTDGPGVPLASKDPVIQIGNTFQVFGESGYEKTIFCLKETGDIPGSNVHWFETEAELLEAWHGYLLAVDPDIIIGYNIKGYDFPYLLERASLLGLRDFAMLGRSERLSQSVARSQASSGFGAFDTRDITIDGRLIFDLFHTIRRDHKLRSYSLNSVSFHFLGEQKEDVSYSSMSGLQNGTKETRRRIASYCLRDTYLPMRLFDKLNILINNTEMARATHVPVDYFSSRGAAIKVLSQIYYEAGKVGYLIPDMDIKSDSEGFEGAFVMDPQKGYYSDPIAVLDFSSLYPSIIISKNMCYTTLLSREQYGQLGGIESPTQNYFCSRGTKEGLLPKILRNLIAARKDARKQLKEATDPFLRKALDGRQQALKVCANSIYGFTGSPTGQLPCIEISQSTTAFGREMISQTKSIIESTFNGDHGYGFNSQVIYGDTDSVMIGFLPLRSDQLEKYNSSESSGNSPPGKLAKNGTGGGVILDRLSLDDRLVEIFAIAKRISSAVSDTFEKPISLEFEKVYCPYLLMNKKRYAGLIYTQPDKPDRIDTKGIETVRRDNCELVKNVIETCLKKILWERDVQGAVTKVKDTVRDLYTGSVDLSQLVISKTYTKATYASKQAHTELAERLKKRGLAIGIGERVPYIIVKGDKKMLAYEKSEDPVYVLENNLPIDTEYYIEQQLSKPVHRLFEPIMDNVSSLFHGEHTKFINHSVPISGPLNAFLRPVEECVGCRKAGRILCDDCRKDFPRHFATITRLYNEKTRQYNECWVECQRCQGSLLNEVLCVNRICPIWYKRTKIKKELAPIQDKLVKIRQIEW